MALFLECVFILLQGITEKSEFISDYSLQLAIVIVYVPLWKNIFCHIQLVFAITNSSNSLELYSNDLS